jgi:Domain of unknown function (DUF4168)
MMNSFGYPSALHLKRVFSKSLLASVVVSAGLLAGLAPDQHSPLPRLVVGSAAYAQDTVTNEEVQNYARSVLAIEPIRQAAYDQIKQITGADVPAIACHQPSSLNNLSSNIREIAVNYCNQSIQIVESNSLTISRFNTITTTLQANPDLASRIQAALIRLQQQPATP